jgi:hypothetical protein
VPLQIAVIITSLLSSSHITYRFGKGLTPKRYRLDMQAMNVLMEEYSRWDRCASAQVHVVLWSES